MVKELIREKNVKYYKYCKHLVDIDAEDISMTEQAWNNLIPWYIEIERTVRLNFLELA